MTKGERTAQRHAQTPVREPGLDGLRGIAIIVVMLFHLVFFEPACRIDHIFRHAAQYGWMGVDLFFVLSGFLITGILLDAKSSPNYFRNFYARRALRILPLYYAFVICLIFLYPLAGAHFRAQRDVLLQNQAWVWTHTVNWLVTLTGDFTSKATLGTGGFWSLSIEEQYYLVWPAVVLLLSEKALLRTCFFLIVTANVARMLMVLLGSSWAAIYTATFAHCDPLALGGALAILAQRPRGLNSLRTRAWAFAAFVIAAFALLDLLITPRIHLKSEFILAVQLMLLPLACGSALVLTRTAASGSLIAVVTQSSILRTFGKYSYSLYLFHGHLVILPDGLGYKIKPEMLLPRFFGSVLPAQLLYLLLAAALCLGLSWVSWNFLENPFLKLKRFFPSGLVSGRRRTPPSAAARQIPRPPPPSEHDIDPNLLAPP